MVTNQKKKRRLTPAVGVTIPQNVQDETNRLFVESVNREIFSGIMSMSKVITALLEIALERADQFDSSKVTDKDSLKVELERILCGGNN
ncbi:TPA: hypothetical protein ACRNCK_005055 [Pseudomonas aeruginosa]|uniref:hypothetical protein n=1 Tax=Pseudomonas aeruginosa TaxID=287 RepID=UPI00053D4B6C|nr:hypothetical protein [Pseudomonas aeruginosa]NPW56340.1 hypothetical protein [Pseudomonas aeruginosa]WCV82153.1 hypothetical protein KKY53_31485 [Pseudomonas aeruginosa]HBO0862492.1 hypothetical protein [Pseudomonas aeruginosa]HBO1428175.1 hypothetical protein [Pseudomonas aeruginosa]HBO1496124.1 hypothetical protein [Pseudomonas aeruginosa]